MARRSNNGQAVSLERIKQEAIRLFGERGYPVIGMRDLSEAVGIRPGSLYSHISSKEHLLLGIVETGITSFIDAIRPVVDEDLPAEEKLREALRAHMRVLDGQVEQTRVTFHQWQYLGPVNRPKALAVREEWESLFTRIVADGIASGEFRPREHFRLTVLMIAGILGSATEWYRPSGRSSPEEIADAIHDQIVGGLTSG
ncbi:TetR/AcrR family transcriptional regulator [Nocardioides gansuensis]|nr:TetR/AcrR family transcriptional regulator [Nocardioides gansuensis]